MPAGSLKAEEINFQVYRLPATLWVPYTTSCNTQSSAPEDGRDHRPKYIDLIGIFNKPLLLHRVGVYIINLYVTHLTFSQIHSFRFLFAGTLKNPSV